MQQNIDANTLIQILGIKKSQAYRLLKDPYIISSLDALKLSNETSGDYLDPFNYSSFNKIQFYEIDYSRTLYWENLFLLLDIVGLRFDELCSFLNLDINIVNLRYGTGKSLPLKDALKIAMFFDLPLPLFHSRKIDFETYKLNFNPKFGKKVYLPTFYLQSPGSRMRTFDSAVKYAKNIYGTEIVEELLKSMQIPLNSLSIPETEIHLVIFRDYHNLFRKLGAKDDYYINMGFSATTSKNNRTQFKQILEVNNRKEVYESCVSTITPKLDLNYTYKVTKIDKNELTIVSRPNKRLFLDGKKSIGSYEIHLYRFGHILGFPTYFNIPIADINKSSHTYDEKNDCSTFTFPI